MSLLGREHLGRPALGRAVDPEARVVPAPHDRPVSRIGEAQEALALEERVAHIGNAPFDARLVLRASDAGGVDDEAARLRVFEEAVV